MEHRTAQATRPQRTRARWRQQTWAVDRRSNGPRLNRAGAETTQRANWTGMVGRRSTDGRLTAAEPKRKRSTVPARDRLHSPANRRRHEPRQREKKLATGAQ